jgi:hypothetical protein
MNNEEIFRDFWANFKWPDAPSVTYRLYYDERGLPLMYSMENHPGSYIEVTPEQYALASHSVRVVEGRLTWPEPQSTFRKYRPSERGMPCHPKDITIVVGSDRPCRHWSKR